MVRTEVPVGVQWELGQTRIDCGFQSNAAITVEVKLFVEFDGYFVEFRVPVAQIERIRQKDAVEFSIDALDFRLEVGLSDIVSFGELQGFM